MDYKYLNVCLIAILVFIDRSHETQGKEVLSRRRRVIGGTSISAGETPWLVSLRGTIVTERLFGFIPVRHKHVYCGGSLLNDKWILTAAHCFDEERDVDAWEVRLAATELKAKLADRFMNLLGQLFNRDDWQVWEIDVTKIIIHPNYDKYDMWANDIALVKLEEPVPSGTKFKHIKRIQLPRPSDKSFPQIGQECVMTGWGCTATGGGVSTQAMSIKLPIENNYVCKTFYRPRTMNRRLCAGFKPSSVQGGICPGDSGGPLVCQNYFGEWIQVGVASFTSRNNPEKFPAVFVRVSDYMYWIHTHVGNLT